MYKTAYRLDNKRAGIDYGNRRNLGDESHGWFMFI